MANFVVRYDPFTTVSCQFYRTQNRHQRSLRNPTLVPQAK
jgi:hypothetical protein